jgi:hypothetical protein
MPINFRFPLDISSQGHFSSNYDTKEATRENIKLTLLTRRGERVMSDVGIDPTVFGLFEQQNKANDVIIESEIRSIFNKYFDSLKLEYVKILRAEDRKDIADNQIVILIAYSFKNIAEENDTLAILVNV